MLSRLLTRIADLSLRTKLLGSFGLVLVVLVILTSAAYQTTAANQQAADAVSHSLQIIGTAHETLTSLVDMETGYRGFLLTGRDEFLEPYLAGQHSAEESLRELGQLSADDPAQAARWAELGALIENWRTDVTERGIALRRDVTAGRRDQDEVEAHVASGGGKRRVDAMRQIVADAIASEQVRLDARQQTSAAARVQLRYVLVIGTMVAVGLGLALTTLLTTDVASHLDRLARSARRLADGDLDERVGSKRKDEIGVASAAFDQMAEHLQTIIDRNEAILVTAAEGIVGLDRDARVTFANPAAVVALGQPTADLVGRGISHRLEPSRSEEPSRNGESHDVPHSPHDPIAQALASGTIEYGADALLRRGDGGTTPIEYTCAPIRERGEVVGAVVTFRDVTERRASEQALADRAKELARSNAELEQFAYVASHDLQEPLRAVVSYLQLLERRYGSQLDERADKYIGYAVDGARRMQALINDLLTYSRAGRRVDERQTIDVEALLERVLKSLEVVIQESGATITHDPLPTIEAELVGFGQLLQNLIGNALKFRGDEPPRVHISATRQDRAWQFAVRDNGIGIASEYQERIFILFQRLHGRDEYAGTGIGLAICKKIAERHGGTLWVESTPGEGSTFLFTIPDAGGTS
jgi:PAS domain S-box-containing protein